MQMPAKKKYKPLFVSFACLNSAGTSSVSQLVTKYPRALTVDGLADLEEFIAKEKEQEQVTILNWKRMEA
jgi:hypothetical protein